MPKPLGRFAPGCVITALRSKTIPIELRDKVHEFYNIAYSEGKLYNEAEILGPLTPNLRHEILSYNRRRLFELVPLIDRAPTTFGSKLAPLLHSRVFFEDELMIEENTTSGSAASSQPTAIVPEKVYTLTST